MRRVLGAFLVVAILFWRGLPVAAGDGDAGPRAIIERAIEAAGGADKLEKLKALAWTEKGTYHGMGAGLPYTGKYAVQWPDRFSMEIEGVFHIVLNGDQGWVKSADGVKEMTKDQIESQRANNRAGWVSSLLPLKDKAFELKALADAKVGADATHVVEASRKDFPTVKMYFNKASGLLVKTEYRIKSPELNNQEVIMEAIHGDYRNLDGAKVSYKTVVHRDGKLFVEAEMSDVRPLGKLDAKVFAKPAE